MWRVASPFIGKSHLSSTLSTLYAAAADDALHTSPCPNSHLLNLTRVEVLIYLAVKCETGLDRVDDAKALFHRMLEFQPLPCVADFSLLLNGVVKMKQFSSSAVLLYREMRFHGVPIDGLTTSNIAIIISLYHLNQVDFGFSILANIFKYGFEPDAVTL